MQHENTKRGYFVTSGTLSLRATTWALGKGIVLVDGADPLAATRNSEINVPTGQRERRNVPERAHYVAIEAARANPGERGRILLDGPPPSNRSWLLQVT